MNKPQIVILMDLRFSTIFLDEVENENIQYSLEDNLDDDLNFTEELLTSATIVGVTSAVLTSIVAIIKHLVPAGKKVEIVQGDRKYNFENCSIAEIEKIIDSSKEKVIINVSDKEM